MMKKEDFEANKCKKSKWYRIGIKLLVILFWIFLWQIITIIMKTPLLLAGPVETALHLMKDVRTVSFWYAIFVSTTRILGGIFAGFLLGDLLAILSYRVSACKQLFAPFIHFCKAVPVASFAVILLVWWGPDFISFAISFLVTLPIAYVNVLEGLEQTDKKMLEMAATFQMPFQNKLFYIYRPALYSFLESILKTGLGMGIKAGVAAEVIGITRNSIGGSLYSAKIYLDSAGVFSWTIVVIILSACIEKCVLYLFKKIMKATPPMAISQNKEREYLRKVIIEDISMSYQGKNLFEHMYKEVDSGKCICVMAPSGYGKTSLLHIIAGLVTPNSGRIIIGKEKVNPGNAGKEKLPIGMDFQEDRLCADLDAVQNVAMIGSTDDISRRCLSDLLLKDQLNQPISKFSGGMKRRVCVARALVSKSAILLFDEPFTGMDEETKKQTIKVMKEYQGNRPMIITTHNKEDVDLLGGELWNLCRQA